jgi:hypothetical protein
MGVEIEKNIWENEYLINIVKKNWKQNKMLVK